MGLWWVIHKWHKSLIFVPLSLTVWCWQKEGLDVHWYREEFLEAVQHAEKYLQDRVLKPGELPSTLQYFSQNSQQQGIIYHNPAYKMSMSKKDWKSHFNTGKLIFKLEISNFYNVKKMFHFVVEGWFPTVFPWVLRSYKSPISKLFYLLTLTFDQAALDVWVHLTSRAFGTLILLIGITIFDPGSQRSNFQNTSFIEIHLWNKYMW